MGRIGAMLIERQMVLCARLHRQVSADGLGGHCVRYTRGERFCAAILPEHESRVRTQDKQELCERYAVTTPEGVGLRFADLFLRERDGAIFRCVGNSRDHVPPRCATFCFEQVRAERFALPDGGCIEEARA